VPVAQTWPHPAQFVGLVRVLTQTPWQSISPAGQPHTPPRQVLPPVHALPQAPQLNGLDVRSTHEAPQAVRRVPHEATHRPTLHTCPEAQLAPQAPQLRLSLTRSTQLPPQETSPARHCAWQAPPLHTRFPAHAWPHDPQLVVLVRRSMHCPEQLVVPVGQVQLPSWQEAPPVHAMTQAPQFP
jgi:hypothetical protein